MAKNQWIDSKIRRHVLGFAETVRELGNDVLEQ
jgi:hypothetical protein